MAFHVAPSPFFGSRRVFTDRGPSVLAWLITLPPLVVGMWSSGFAFFLGIAIALAWAISLPIAAYNPRTRWALLPVAVAVLGFVTTLLAMPFNSLGFWVFSWTSLVMLLMAVPKPLKAHWEEKVR
jgi:hypothetical protein